MAPAEYIRVRSEAASKESSYSETVDGKPYFPFLEADASDEATIKDIAIAFTQQLENASELSIKKVIGGNTNLLYCVSVVSGGITNKLYRVDFDETNAVLVRIFGAVGLIDRDIENSVYAALAQKRIAPPYLGRFANGRVEGWLEMRALEVPELGKFNKQIAEQLGKLHIDFVPETQEKPTMWTQLRSWMEQALVAKFQNDKDEERAAALDLASLSAELDWLQESVVPNDSKVAFCHNDALAANIMVSSDLENIQLIDFEYGGSNYVAFDIANHFNEYAGGTDHGVPDYGLFPNAEKQIEFVRAYLLSVNGSDPTDDEVKALHIEVEAFLLVNNLYWGLWAVNQGATEGCDDFDYLLYAKHRIGRYRSTKN
jgi:ethanolamine kinase